MKSNRQSTVTTQRLYRRERLRSTADIGRLFEPQAGARHRQDGASAGNGVGQERPRCVMAYPWRAVWLPSAHEEVDFTRILVMVPKRRLRHAVDRVTMRRRLREAYRRLRAEIVTPVCRIDIAFIYVADKLTPFDDTCRSLRKIFARITSSLSDETIPADQ